MEFIHNKSYSLLLLVELDKYLSLFVFEGGIFFDEVSLPKKTVILLPLFTINEFFFSSPFFSGDKNNSF